MRYGFMGGLLVYWDMLAMDGILEHGVGTLGGDQRWSFFEDIFGAASY
jgi:hypothetical protein